MRWLTTSATWLLAKLSNKQQPAAASGSTTPQTWQSLFQAAVAQLAASGLELVGDSAEVEARHLLQTVAGLSQTELLAGWAEPASERAEVQLEQKLQERLSGKPLQYVLGSWGFRSLDLYVDERVLIPRPETECVVEVAMQELQHRQEALSQTQHQRSRLRVADLGCGSGAIGLSIAAERTDVEVFCCDISPDALAVTRANLAGLGMAASPVQLAQGSWYVALESVGAESGFDLICSNPPYVAESEALPPSVANFEPAEALYAGADGTEALAELIGGAVSWLADGGSLVCELAPTQAEFASVLAQQCGLVEVEVRHDLAGRPRVLRARTPNPSVGG